MHVWDVFARRKDGDPWDLAGSVNAPDLDMAILLVRETHFRHGEGRSYAVRRRGEEKLHEVLEPVGIGGVIDRAYRRSDGYAGVGAKHKRVTAMMAERGLVIDRPRPPDRRSPTRTGTGHG